MEKKKTSNTDDLAKYQHHFRTYFKRTRFCNAAAVVAGRVYGFLSSIPGFASRVSVYIYLWIDGELWQSIHGWETSFGPAQHL